MWWHIFQSFISLKSSKYVDFNFCIIIHFEYLHYCKFENLSFNIPKQYKCVATCMNQDTQSDTSKEHKYITTLCVWIKMSKATHQKSTSILLHYVFELKCPKHYTKTTHQNNTTFSIHTMIWMSIFLLH